MTLSTARAARAARAVLAVSALRRLLLAAAVLLPAAVLGGAGLQRASIPAMTAVFEAVAPDLAVRRMRVQAVDGEQRVTVAVTLARTTVIGERVMLADPRGEATAFTPAGHALVAPLVAALAAAAWPARSRREQVLRLGLWLPIGWALLIIDPSLMLASTIWQLLVDGAAPGTSSLLGSVAGFLLGGGRIVLGMAVAAGIVGICRRKPAPG